MPSKGGNVSIALEEAPKLPVKTTDTRAWHVVAVSARTPASLHQNCERLLDFLERHPETKLADLAYTTTARRMHEQLRRAYVGDSVASIVRQLRSDVSKSADASQIKKPRVPSRVFAFTGQGSQYAGMGAVLFRTSRQFRATLLSYQDMASSVGLPRFVDLISGEEEDLAGQSTVKIQLAIVALEISMARLVESWGITPDVVIGHSLGEYAALCVAGVLSISEALLLVGERAALMEKHLVADAYAMLAVSTTEEALAESIRKLGLGSCAVACANAPSLTVASGPITDIDALKGALEADGQRATLLRVPYGFHSSQVEPVLDEYLRVAQGVPFAEPSIPVVSTLTGRVEREAPSFSPEYLVRQARDKVNFTGAVEAGVEAGLFGDQSLWLEIGPDPVCLGLVRRCLDKPSHLVPSLKQGKDNWATVSELLKRAYECGIDVDWPEFHKPFTGSLTLIDLPTYAFDSRDFWTPYMTEVPSAAPAVTNGTLGFPTTTLQRVESENTEGTAKIVTFTSSLSDERLLEAIKGHVVGGFEVCPLAVYQDIALTAGKYLYHSTHGNASTLPAMSIRQVELGQGLIIDPETVSSTVLYVTGSYKVADAAVDIEFSSKRAGQLTQHGKCQVAFGTTASWQTTLPQTLYLVKSRLDLLRKQAEFGNARHLLKQETYELFSGVVSYAAPYQAIQKVILGADYADAVGTVKLADVSMRGTFHFSPYWLDAVTHLAGFVLNCGLRYPEDIACLAVGFDAWHSLRELKSGETYTVYTCLQDVADEGHVVRGDCYVFAGADLVQATLGIKFLRLKKVALNMILGGGRASVAGRSEVPQNRSSTSNTNITPEAALPTKAAESGSTPDEMIKTLLAIIISESGCSPDEVSDESHYSDLGVDSVMAINILAQLSKELDLHLPAAFFLENETIGDSKKSLLAHLGTTDEEEEADDDNNNNEPETTPPKPPSSVTWSEPSHSNTATTSTSTPSTPPEPADADTANTPPTPDLAKANLLLPSTNTDHTPTPTTTSTTTAQITHYQGPRTPTTPNLFLLPDETGSSFAYIALPPLGAELGVYGVDLPHLEREGATHIQSTAATAAMAATAAIRAEQPVGPYMLAGAGAVGAGLAYEVARGLLGAGEGVDVLVLMDCGGSGAGEGLAPLVGEGEGRVKVAVQVLAAGEGGEGGDGWAKLVPGLEVCRAEVESGMFLDFSMVSFLVRFCSSSLSACVFWLLLCFGVY